MIKFGKYWSVMVVAGVLLGALLALPGLADRERLAELVTELQHPRLVRRLAALERLEELAGTTCGYDPWGGSEANQTALAEWHKWLDSGEVTNTQVYAVLSVEQVARYIEDLGLEDTERSSRAARMLELAGAAIRPALDDWLTNGVPKHAIAEQRVREVRYCLMLPELLGNERRRIAQRLVFGTQDERLQGLAQTAKGGKQGVPLLAEFLKDKDPFAREAAVDAIIAAGGSEAVKPLLSLLEQEQDEGVIHAVIRGAGKLNAGDTWQLLERFLAHENDDLVVAALASLSRSRSKKAAQRVTEVLSHKEWRVRVAALEALAGLREKNAEGAVAACLKDEDPFVQRTAVATLVTLGAKKSLESLAEAFMRDDHLKAPVVAAYRNLHMLMPDSFAAELEGKSVDLLLGVLDALDDGDYDSWLLAVPLVAHASDDVACAAIRVVATGNTARVKEGHDALVKAVQSGREERILAVYTYYPPVRSFFSFDDGAIEYDFDQLIAESEALHDKADTGSSLADIFAAFKPAKEEQGKQEKVAAAGNVTLGDLFAAFGGDGDSQKEARKKTTISSDSDLLLLEGAAACLAPDKPRAMRMAGAMSLMALDDERGVRAVMAMLDDTSAAERVTIIIRGGTNRGSLFAGLMERMLSDTSPDVRMAAVELILKRGAEREMLQRLMTATFADHSPLQPKELLDSPYLWRKSLKGALGQRVVGETVRSYLTRSGGRVADVSQLILAVALLDACWQSADLELVEPLCTHSDPFVRRVAWAAIGNNRWHLFKERVESLAADTSEWVRSLVAELGCGEDIELYFDAKTRIDALESYNYSSSRRKAVTPEMTAVLESMCNDQSIRVRGAAAKALLANRVKLETEILLELLQAGSDQERHNAADEIVDLLGKTATIWLREQPQRDLLRLLEHLTPLVSPNQYTASKLERVGDAISEAGQVPEVDYNTVLMRPGESHPIWGGNLQIANAETGDDTKPVRETTEESLVIYFTNPGCRECSKVAEMLHVLAGELPAVNVKEYNLRNPEYAQLNEVLCERFEVQALHHLTAPAVFTGAGVLIRSEITFTALQELITNPQTRTRGWELASTGEIDKAGEKIGERYKSFTPWMVVGAGLADGVNPCAFATIIFLLSYLQIARRKPHELLAAGISFIAAVFITYLLLGVLLVEIVERLTLLQRFAPLLNWVLIVVVALLALLNFWDGIQCLRGKMGDMVLQLPGSFKERIRGVVRRSTRQRHFVAAAFLAGCAISLIELACTGQVYAPTLLYILKTSTSHHGVIGYLVLYNIAFVVPLAVVFGGAYGGLRSERVTLWLQQRAAPVKFATAIFFVLLLVLLLHM